ncbi:MAG TPA: ATP phosphoribosyltransferase regulatory subunit [Halanaerobiales bacterium]|nr:ATP phosphoribosyltransferase regulatory subunit [Halanaerobiales bacterium]
MNAFVEGVRDILPAELRRRRAIYKRIRKVFQNADYREVITPTLESLELYSGIEGVIDKSEMFKVVDENGQILVLRPDVTMPIARLAATRFQDTPRPLKFSYLTTAYQSKNSQSLSLKEKTQAGVELIGSDKLCSDIEMIALLIKTMKAIHIEKPLIDIGHADLINEIFCTMDLTEKQRDNLLSLLSAKNKVEIRRYLNEIEIAEESKEVLMKLPTLFGKPDDVIPELKQLPISEEAHQEVLKLEKLFNRLDELGLIENITFDPMLISRHGYYTGVIFKGYAGSHNVLLANGGRYDNLTEKFGVGEPAVGFALEIENVLEYLNKTHYEFEAQSARVIINYHEEDNFSDAYHLAEELRDKDYIVEIFEEGKDQEYIDFQGLDFQIECIEDNLVISNIKNGKELTVNKKDSDNNLAEVVIDKLKEVK